MAKRMAAMKPAVWMAVAALLLVGWGALHAQAAGSEHIYMFIVRKHDKDPMPGYGVKLGSMVSQVSAEDARDRVCVGAYKWELDRSTTACAAQPGLRPYPGIPHFTCADMVAVQTHNYESCVSPQNSVKCSGPAFWAQARSARMNEQPAGGQDQVGEGPAVGGVACGKRSAKATMDTALAACEKARKAQGIADVQCYPHAEGQLK